MMPRGERIPIAADHAGFEMKQKLVGVLRKLGYEPEDLGAKSPEPSDYPDYGHPVANAVSTGEVKRGVLLCGSGIGMDIVANRHPHVRAALAWNPEIAKLSRSHNDSNILVLPSRFMSADEAEQSLRIWLDTPFEGGRHERRVEKIDQEVE
jgi:ribose 5-phosphate isomerase B